MNGPDPTAVVSGFIASVSASAFLRIAAMPEPLQASAISTKGNGVLNTIFTVSAPSASKEASAASMRRPSASRFIQRRIDGTTSAPVTGWPSWNLRPGRSLKV